MRSGLVAVGLALVVVGAVVGYTGISIVGPTQSRGFTQALSVPNIMPFHQRVDVVHVTNSSSATFVVSWTSTQALNVTLYQGVPCGSSSGYCETAGPLAQWPSNTSGQWSHNGRVTDPYLLAIENLQPSNTSLVGSLAESYPDGHGSAPTSTVLTILAGGVLLIAIGGLALFLGLFLRSGVYSEPESLSPRYAHELDRAADPLDEPFDEDLGPEEDVPGPPGTH